ncbi:Oxidoreductase [Azospirillaceae bacterium]
MPLLLKDGQPADDTWTTVDDDAKALPEGPVIVGLARWHRDRALLTARNTPLGIRLKSQEGAEEIAADLDRFTLVALEFPKYRDGRAFTTARALREYHGYGGEIRAVGHTIPDQYLFLVRTGFTSVEVDDGANLASWRQALTEFSIAYQHDRTAAAPLSGLRRRLTSTMPS